MSFDAKFQLQDGDTWSDHGSIVTGLAGPAGPSLTLTSAHVGKKVRIGVRPAGGDWVYSAATGLITARTGLYFTSTDNPPPSMAGATVITLPNPALETDWPEFGEAPAGKVYYYQGSAGEDVIFRFNGITPLKYPLICSGGRHTRYVGLEFSIITQPGGFVGQIGNERPHFPQTSVIQNSCSGEVFIEGVLMEINGNAGDCIVMTQEHLTANQARSQRHVTIKNTHLRGFTGDVSVHGDIFQPQNRCVGNVTVDRLTVYSAQEGFTLENFDGGSAQAVHLKLRNFDFHRDIRYTPHDNVYGAPVSAISDTWETENCFIDPNWVGYGAHSFWWNNSGGFPGSGDQYGPSHIAKAGISVGLPPGGEFAPANKVGRFYVSPHD